LSLGYGVPEAGPVVPRASRPAAFRKARTLSMIEGDVIFK
jgi:hypothetical protein